MFAARQFANRYFATRYFPPVGAAAVAMEIFANTRYEVYIRQHGNTFVHTQIVFTGTDFGLIDT